MRAEARQTIKAIRAFLWIVPFYIVALLIKIYNTHRPALSHSIHILTFGIAAGAVCILAILYQSRAEATPQKQWKHLFSATLLTGVLYGLCCLLSYAFSGGWEFIYI
jgi:hypothetical protein